MKVISAKAKFAKMSYKDNQAIVGKSKLQARDFGASRMTLPELQRAKARALRRVKKFQKDSNDAAVMYQAQATAYTEYAAQRYDVMI
jgi:hypothetical protein